MAPLLHYCQEPIEAGPSEMLVIHMSSQPQLPLEELFTYTFPSTQARVIYLD